VADRIAQTPDAHVPPPAEAIHMPEPSYLPVILAFGLMLALVGLILTFVISAIGLIIFLVALIRWIGQSRAEMRELPLEHGSH
jgi:uncharacterized membrane protein